MPAISGIKEKAGEREMREGGRETERNVLYVSPFCFYILPGICAH